MDKGELTFRVVFRLLFGIKGKRWIENPNFNHIINEHFVFPNDADKVQHAQKVEGACYW